MRVHDIFFGIFLHQLLRLVFFYAIATRCGTICLSNMHKSVKIIMCTFGIVSKLISLYNSNIPHKE